MFRYILCVCLVLTGCASTKQTAYIDQPVRVSGEGRTFEEAKQNAFSNAVEYAVGAVVITETEVSKHKLIKDEIIKHSSGYIDDYMVIEQSEKNNQVYLTMFVKVKHSAIAERIINIKTASGEIQGERMSSVHSSFITQKETGDKVLEKVLMSYPHHAFNIEKGNIEYLVNINRQPVIEIEYKITWNYAYIKALNEALTLTQDPKDRTIRQKRIDVQHKAPNNFLFGTTDTYYFNDVKRSDMIISSLRRPFYVYFSFKGQNGELLKQGCSDTLLMNGMYQNGAFVVEGNEKISETHVRTIKTNPEKIKNIVSIDLTIETKPCTIIN